MLSSRGGNASATPIALGDISARDGPPDCVVAVLDGVLGRSRLGGGPGSASDDAYEIEANWLRVGLR